MKYRARRKTLAAAVRIEETLYRGAMERVAAQDLTFSRYVRGLVRADLKQAGLLPHGLESELVTN